MYTKKPAKKLEPLEDMSAITVSRIKAHIADLRTDTHKSENIQLLINKWEDRLERLQRRATRAERIAYLANTIKNYKFKQQLQ